MRGLSTRDIEELAKEAGLGTVSRTAVSRVCQELRARYRAFCAHLRHPPHLKKRPRSTNLLERSFEQVQRRVEVIGRFPGESSCPSLSWAVLDLVIARGLGLGLTDFDMRHLDELRAARSRSTAETIPKTA